MPPTTSRIVDPLAADFGEPPEQQPAPEAELTPEQQRIKELEHQLALLVGRKDAPPEGFEDPPAEGDTDTILIYFETDGFTALGKMWYRGQELEFVPGSQAYEDTKDTRGFSWLNMDPAYQLRRFGKVFFRHGPWPGETYDVIHPFDFPPLKEIGSEDTVRITEDDLRRAAAREAERRKAAPRLPRIGLRGSAPSK